MTRITVTPGPMELALNRPAYQALVEDLQEQGYEAALEPPTEERFGLPQEIVNVALVVWEEIDEATKGAIITLLLERMFRSRKPPPKPPPRPPTGRLLGPRGEVLWEGQIPAGENQQPAP